MLAWVSLLPLRASGNIKPSNFDSEAYNEEISSIHYLKALFVPFQFESTLKLNLRQENRYNLKACDEIFVSFHLQIVTFFSDQYVTERAKL